MNRDVQSYANVKIQKDLHQLEDQTPSGRFTAVAAI